MENPPTEIRKCRVFTDIYERVQYDQGDIVGVWGRGPLGWLNRNFILPSTDMFHFLLIGSKIPGEDDYAVLESVNKGVTVGRLSWYTDRSYNVFRLNRPDSVEIGNSAYLKATKFGRHRYDWKMPFKLAWTFITRRFRPCYVTEIPYQRDHDFLCTELVFEAYRLAGVRLRQSGHAPMPAEFVLCTERKVIVQIDHHDAVKTRLPKPVTIQKAVLDGQEPKPMVAVIGNDKTDFHRTIHDAVEATKIQPITARQGGQKRNRYHLYVPVNKKKFDGAYFRVCDWAGNNEIFLEDIVPVKGEAALALGARVIRHKDVCQNCKAVVAGRRTYGPGNQYWKDE